MYAEGAGEVKVHQILSLRKSEPRTRRGRGPRSRSSASRPGCWTTRRGRWHGISSSSHRGRSPSDRAPAAEALGGKNRGVSSAAAGGRSRGSRWTRWLVTRQWRRPRSPLGSRETETDIPRGSVRCGRRVEVHRRARGRRTDHRTLSNRRRRREEFYPGAVVVPGSTRG
jgi:hypothetical protein